MNEVEKIALFDAYLGGELADSDKNDFERLLETNQDFKAEFEDYKSVSQEIFEGQEYAEIKAQLQGIHASTQGSSEDDKGSSRPFILRPKFMIPLGIAAGIALIVMIVDLFGGATGNDDMADNGNVTAVDEDVIRPLGTDDMADEAEEGYAIEEQYEMDSTHTVVDKLDEILPLGGGKPKGTCFLISKNGYFITSKHLVRKRRYVKVQQKDRDVAFFTEVIYRDSVLDLAILKCSEEKAKDFESVPFKFSRGDIELGDDVFALGYPKSDIVYKKGAVSSETGFRSDSMSYEIDLPANPGYSGAPLFTKRGDLIGLVIANNSKKQSVTYILRPEALQNGINKVKNDYNIDISTNYTKRCNKTSDLIKKYRPYIFEIR